MWDWGARACTCGLRSGIAGIRSEVDCETCVPLYVYVLMLRHAAACDSLRLLF